MLWTGFGELDQFKTKKIEGSAPLHPSAPPCMSSALGGLLAGVGAHFGGVLSVQFLDATNIVTAGTSDMVRRIDCGVAAMQRGDRPFDSGKCRTVPTTNTLFDHLLRFITRDTRE